MNILFFNLRIKSHKITSSISIYQVACQIAAETSNIEGLVLFCLPFAKFASNPLLNHMAYDSGTFIRHTSTALPPHKPLTKTIRTVLDKCVHTLTRGIHVNAVAQSLIHNSIEQTVCCLFLRVWTSAQYRLECNMGSHWVSGKCHDWRNLSLVWIDGNRLNSRVMVGTRLLKQIWFSTQNIWPIGYMVW